MSGKPLDSQKLLLNALRSFIQNGEDFFFVKDACYRYCESSASLETFTNGKDAKPFTGMDDYQLYPKKFADKYRADDRLVIEEGRSILGMIESIPGKDGSVQLMQTWKRPVRDEEGNILGLYGYSKNITQLLELEDKAKKAQTFVELIDNIPGGVGIFHFQNERLFLDYVNEGFLQVHHIGRESGKRFLGENVIYGVLEEDRPHVLAICKDVCSSKNGQKGGASYRFMGDDAVIHWVDVQISPAYERAGIQYFYATFTNLDMLKATEMKLRESQDALNEAISNSDTQYFTYYPDKHAILIFALNTRYSELPDKWENFPESFLEFVKAPEEDARMYREMVRKIDNGEAESECSLRVNYRGVYLWLHVHMVAIKDKDGKTIKAQGYSQDVTSRKNAEARLQDERLKLRSMEGNIIEAFSYNITRNAQNIMFGTGVFDYHEPIEEEVVLDALKNAPPVPDANNQTRSLLLAAAQQTMPGKDRELLLRNFSLKAIRQACNEGRYGTILTYRRIVHGSVRWVSTSLEVLPDPESGDLIAFFYTRDVNDEILRTKLSECLINRSCLWAALYETGTKTIFVKQGAGFIEMSFAEAVEHCVNDMVDAASVEEFRSVGNVEKVNQQVAEKGEYIFFFSGKPVREDLPGKPKTRIKADAFYLDEAKDTIVFLLSDVTEVFEQESESRELLARALRIAESANHAKTDFLSRISHDIRTPMNVIISKLDFALEDMDDKGKLLKDLSDIKSASSFLLSLINDILDISKIDSGSVELHPEPYPYKEYLQLVTNMFKPLCARKGLTLEIFRDTAAGDIIIDRVRLNQITLNLLSNAVKYTPCGGVITFTSGNRKENSERGLVWIEVKDTGIGMTKEFQKKMFEPFTREAQTGGQLFEQGTGLGLSIVKRLVDLMQGSITVVSEKGKGTDIRVAFPCRQVDQDSLSRFEEEHPEGNIGELQHLSGTILIVEDHPMNAEIASRIIRKTGLEVRSAENGKLAVERFSASLPGEFKAILMDIQMPVMDGYEATRAIRALDREDARTVPILAMTADAYQEDISRCMAAGMNGHISKPLDQHELYRKLASLIAH